MNKRNKWQRALLVVLGAAGGWLVLWLLGPALLPFLLGFGIAKAAEPAVRGLSGRCRVPRWAAAALGVSAVYLFLGLALFLLGRILWKELAGFVQALPELVQPAAQLEPWLLSLTERFPDTIAKGLQAGITEFFRSGTGIAQKLYDGIFSFASGLLKKLPDVFLFILTAVLSSYMLASQLPQLMALWQKKAPERWQQWADALLRRLRNTLGGWCKAQGKLMLVTFFILTVGFFLLRIQYPLLFSTVIALIDALPVFGSGTILIPWALLSFLQRDTVRGIGLLCLYGAAALIRTALEPRLIGRQFGLDPLATLAAIYVGYHFFGVPGMVLFPILAMLVKQFWRGEEGAVSP